MKKIILLYIFLVSYHPLFAQLDDTNSSNNGSMTLGSGTGVFYQFAGDQRGDATNQSQGGFGILSGAHQISPIIWMYDYGGRNAFQVRKKGYNITVQDGITLFQVGVDGSVGIGTTDTKGFKLGVRGKIAAEEVKVAGYHLWPDFVFGDSYSLPKLSDVESYIKEKGHLRGIPSAKEVAKNGFHLGEMDAKLLQKIEELTLYTIAQEKQINDQNSKIEKISKENEELKIMLKRLSKIEEILAVEKN